MVNPCRGAAEQALNWLPVASPDALKEGEIHLCFVHFAPLFADLPRLYRQLTPKESARAEKIKSAERRNLYAAGRWTLRYLLGKYLPDQPLAFVYGARGKPGLQANGIDTGVRFNYSLSHGAGLYAFSRAYEVGVDLEHYPRPVNIAGLLRRIASSEEKAIWNQVEVSSHGYAVLQFWTRKEAYGKLLGVGIRYHLHRVTVFKNLQNPNWQTRVEGLFEQSHAGFPGAVNGVQLRLPVPGAGSLVYAADHADSGIESGACELSDAAILVCHVINAGFPE